MQETETVKTEPKTKTVQKKIRCIVVSDKMNKSRVGLMERMVKHPAYGKYLKRSTKYMFHDEKNETKIGDEVTILQCRPISARKTFTLSTIVKSA